MHKKHHGCVEAFVNECGHHGYDVTVAHEKTLQPEDVLGKDLVIAMGGDHTFLKSSSICDSTKVPILGINTYRAVQFGAHLQNHMEWKTRR